MNELSERPMTMANPMGGIKNRLGNKEEELKEINNRLKLQQ
jgi:hypothetical protein